MGVNCHTRMRVCASTGVTPRCDSCARAGTKLGATRSARLERAPAHHHRLGPTGQFSSPTHTHTMRTRTGTRAHTHAHARAASGLYRRRKMHQPEPSCSTLSLSRADRSHYASARTPGAAPRHLYRPAPHLDSALPRRWTHHSSRVYTAGALCCAEWDDGWSEGLLTNRDVIHASCSLCRWTPPR